MNIPPKIAELQQTISAKLDASPRVVWNWRDLWKTWYVRITALGAALMFVLSTAIWISPLLGFLFEGWLPTGIALTVGGFVMTAGLIARYLTQAGGTPSNKPE